MYEIYSIGDGAYLAAVLNAVAMISGSGDMRQLTGVGFLIGVLLVMGQGMIQAKFPPLQNFLLAWVLYMAMFGPVARVQVEDVYSGATRDVDNVPLGVAFVGSAMSQIGYGVTVLFEQGFSTPAMTEYGFAAPLTLLQDVRKGTWSRMAQGKANSPTSGADMERSWSNYINECLLYAVDVGLTSIQDVVHDPSWTSAFAPRGLVAPTTQLWVGGAPVTETCTTAWARLSAYTTTQYTPALRQSIAATLGVDPANVEGSVQGALDALAGMGVDAQNYMVMAGLLPFWDSGNAERYREIGRYDEAVMIEQAAQQRNTQWAAEERLFARIVRPMMTFFEAFLFAISPLMMFAIGLGPVGIKMIGKYMMFALWIQLWKPILAVINLYVIMAAQGKLDALQATALGDTPVPSMGSLWKMDIILSDYLGVGGMLAASTPAISLMLIYGSAMTATHLAGRLQGGDHVNEKTLSPDVAQPAAALGMAPIISHTGLTGAITHQAERVLPTFDMGKAMDNTVSSASAFQTQASRSFDSALASSAEKGASIKGESFTDSARKYGYGSSQSHTDQYLHDQAEDMGRQFNLGASSTDKIAAAMTVGAQVAAKGGSKQETREAIASQIHGIGARSHGESSNKGVDGGINLTGLLRGEHDSSTQVTEQVTDSILSKVTSGGGIRAELASKLALDIGKGDRNVYTDGLSREDSSTLGQRASDLVSANRTYQSAASMSQRSGASGSYGAAQVGHRIAADPAAHGRVRAVVERFGLTGDVQRTADKYDHLMSRPQAEAVAAMTLLTGYDKPEYRRMTDEERVLASASGVQIISDLMGGPGASGADPYANSGIAGQTPGYGGVANAVGGVGLYDPRSETRGVPGRVAGHHARIGGQVAGTPGEVTRGWDDGRAAVARGHRSKQTDLLAQKRESIESEIRSQAILPRSLTRMTVDELGGLAISTSYAMSSWSAGASGAMGRFLDAYSGGSGILDAVKAAGNGWSEARQELIDTHVDQVRGTGPGQLTDAQMDVYRLGMESAIPEVGGVHRMMDTELSQAKQRLIQEEGPIGDQMAVLLTRAATSQQESALMPIRARNRTDRELDALPRAGSRVPGPLTANPSDGSLKFNHPWQDQLNPGLRNALLATSASMNTPLTVLSGYRDKDYNDAKGGAKNSQHVHHNAADLDMKDMNAAQRTELVTTLIDNGVTRFGTYDTHRDMLHVDTSGNSPYFMHNKTRHQMDSAKPWFKRIADQYS